MTFPRPKDQILSGLNDASAIQRTVFALYLFHWPGPSQYQVPDLSRLRLLGYRPRQYLVEIHDGAIGGLTASLRPRLYLP